MQRAGHIPGFGGSARKQAGQIGDNSGRRGIFVVGAFDEAHFRVGRFDAGVVINHDQMPGADFVARAKTALAGELHAVEQRAVLAAQIANVPLPGFAFENQMLAREAGVLRKAQLGGTGPSQHHALALQPELAGFPVRAQDMEFVGTSFGHGAMAYLRRRCIDCGSTCVKPGGTSNFEASTGADEKPESSVVISIREAEPSLAPRADNAAAASS